MDESKEKQRIKEKEAFEVGQKDYGMRLLVLYGFREDAEILFRRKYLDKLSDGKALTDEDLTRIALHGARMPRKDRKDLWGDRA